jgi:hypothetical protein
VLGFQVQDLPALRRQDVVALHSRRWHLPQSGYRFRPGP